MLVEEVTAGRVLFFVVPILFSIGSRGCVGLRVLSGRYCGFTTVREGCVRRLGRDRHTTMLCGSKPSLIVTNTNSKGAHILACGVTCLLRGSCGP